MGAWVYFLTSVGGGLFGALDAIIIFLATRRIVEKPVVRWRALLQMVVGLRLLVIFLVLGLVIRSLGLWPFIGFAATFFVTRIIGLLLLGRAQRAGASRSGTGEGAPEGEEVTSEGDIPLDGSPEPSGDGEAPEAGEQIR